MFLQLKNKSSSELKKQIHELDEYIRQAKEIKEEIKQELRSRSIKRCKKGYTK